MEERFKTFTVQIAKISRCIRKIKSEEMQEFNLKSPHVSCLYYLYRQNGLTAKELCDMCDEDKAAISRSIDFLENNGYIVCSSKTEKRYRSPLSLTEKGVKIAAKIAVKIDKMVDIASVGLSEENRVILYQSLHLISSNLQKFCDSYEE